MSDTQQGGGAKIAENYWHGNEDSSDDSRKNLSKKKRESQRKIMVLK